ncbi:MAG: glycine cleavage system protein GcvH [Chloroflexota bacterium]
MLPDELRFSAEHFWVRDEGGGRVRLGITDYYQGQLNNIIFIELPKIDVQLRKGGVLGSIESSKTISDLVSPLSGRVVGLNDLLKDKPDLINKDPYGAGWMIVMKLDNMKELDSLLSAHEYETLTAKST